MIADFKNLHIINTLPGYFLWKDGKSNFIAASESTAKIFGFNNSSELLGLTDYDVKGVNVESAEIWAKQDEHVRKLRKPCTFIDISTYADGKSHILRIQKQLFTHLNDEDCIACYCHELSEAELHHTILNIHQAQLDCTKYLKAQIQSLYLNAEYGGLGLTEKQSHCLYYYIRGYTAKDIAKLLHISFRSSEKRILAIKEKLQLNKRSEIVEKILALQYQYIVPEGLE